MQTPKKRGRKVGSKVINGKVVLLSSITNQPNNEFRIENPLAMADETPQSRCHRVGSRIVDGKAVLPGLIIGGSDDEDDESLSAKYSPTTGNQTDDDFTTAQLDTDEDFDEDTLMEDTTSHCKTSASPTNDGINLILLQLENSVKRVKVRERGLTRMRITK